ncbi:hypothetical protein Y032_0047g1497 [Ancylostoma ceylanicum]|uniref:RRM domain-containing protein n=1 Tax=Ancylostoma ceylanicum TaxID=53326 RepID=A0A016UCA9_9BILA|nr:hypothetical protein Y032_0047g1497 [Ancylostoma ceylanicum]
MNNAFDRRERTVFVSMIHRSVTDDDLYEIMSQAGPIEKIIFKENADGTLLHALVIFRNIESVIFSMFHLQPVAKGPKLIQIRPLRSLSAYCSHLQLYIKNVFIRDRISTESEHCVTPPSRN